MSPENAPFGDDPYEAQVREMLKRVIPRGYREAVAKALSAKVGRNITVKRLGNLIEPGKQAPRMSLSTAKALTEVLSEMASADSAPLRRFLNNEDELNLLRDNMRAIQKLLERV
ncbi:MAG: hypothetical protein ACLP0H_11580, partial [Terriglobales bacterium]